MGKLVGRKRGDFSRPDLPANQRANDDTCEQRKNEGRGQKVYTNTLLAPYRNIRRRPERGAVWRIAPPLTVTTDEIDRAITILDQALVEGINELCRNSR